jgi:hydrogenase expression/formation protein
LTEIEEVGIKVNVIGEVNTKKNEINLIRENGETKLFPRFRESAYTPIKQEIGEEINEDEKHQLAARIEECATQALQKRSNFVKWIEKNITNRD